MDFTSFVQDEVIKTMQKDFEFPLKKRMRVVAEVDKFKWKEDESVWKQKRGKTALEFEVYFDGEFICFFNQDEVLDNVRIKILEKMLELYKAKKIYFNESLRDEMLKEEKKKKEEENTIIYDNVNTPEEKIIVEAVKRQAKKRGKRVLTR